MELKIAVEAMGSSDFVLSAHCESDELPQHESMEFCLYYPFPIDLKGLWHTEELFSHGLRPRNKNPVFLTPSPRGAISLTRLET